LGPFLKKPVENIETRKKQGNGYTLTGIDGDDQRYIKNCSGEFLLP